MYVIRGCPATLIFCVLCIVAFCVGLDMLEAIDKKTESMQPDLVAKPNELGGKLFKKCSFYSTHGKTNTGR
jgi:hypothetical protein